MKTKKRKENEINKARKFKTIITIALSVMVVLVAVAWYYLEDKDLFVKVAFFTLWVGIATLFSNVYRRNNDYIEKRQDEIREIELEERAKIKRDFAEYIELVEEALKEAELELMQEANNNQEYYKRAVKSAENIIVNLIKQLNPDIPNLIVKVEFIN